MTDSKKFYRKLRVSLLLLLVMLWLASALACAERHVAAQTPAPPSAQAVPPAADESAHSTPPPPESRLSAKDAEELFRSVTEILQFSSKDTALPIKHEVKPRLTSRDEVVAYLEKSMAEDKDAQRLRRSELVLKKFGLLPRDFNLGDFLVKLLREQVAGYYDPKTKAVNLLDWVDIDQQRPVMAHELTHALQDQSFGLEKWMRSGAGDLVESNKEPTAEDIANDEIDTARQAVVEGQATLTMLDYTLAPAGQSALDSPRLVEAFKAGMLVGTPDSVQFRDAPLFLKESLTFPYRYGLDFETALLAKGGKEKAFAGVFRNPPHTTREIMQPETYLSGEHLEPMRLPDFKPIFKKYERFDIGAVGEFDVAVLIGQYAGGEASRELYPHWRGGYYYAVRPKGDPAAPLGLLYVSRWSNAERSAEFGAIYAKSLLKRYLHVRDVGEGKDAAADLKDLETLVGRHTWLTEDGPVVIEVTGDTMLVTESLEPATTGELEQAIFDSAVAPK